MFSKLIERLTYFFFVVEIDWEIGVAESDFSNILSKKKITGIKWFPKRRGFYQADPFGVYENDRHYIFYEEFERAKKCSTINCKVLDNDLHQIDDRVILRDGKHFSFPFILFYQEEYYMLPENVSKRCLILYKAEKFPFVWREIKVMLDQPCSDSVLFHHGRTWWLLYTKTYIENANGILFLRCSDDIFGDWESCEEIAIQNGSYNSRNAGTICFKEGRIFRPAQNCTHKYGESVVINEITKLSFPDFEEKIVREIKLALPYNLSFHTLSACGRFSLVDGMRRRLYRKPLTQLIRQVYRKAKKKL